VQRGEGGKKAGFPRFKGRYGNRYHSFTYKEDGNGVRLDNGVLALSKIGRSSVPWSRSLEGIPKPVTVTKAADGWYVSFSCAEVPTRPLPPIGQETGIDLGVASFATLADSTMIHNPRCSRTAERYLAKCQRRVSKRKQAGQRPTTQGSLLARQGTADGAEAAPSLPPQDRAGARAALRHALS
jgi:putative transposase